MNESDSRTRRRWVTLGEIIGVAALLISALGLWITWRATQDDRPTRVVEQRQPIPLTLRGKAERDGRELVIAPVEPSHALESVKFFISGIDAMELGSEGSLKADDVAAKLSGKDLDKGAHSIKVRITAR